MTSGMIYPILAVESLQIGSHDHVESHPIASQDDK